MDGTGADGPGAGGPKAGDPGEGRAALILPRAALVARILAETAPILVIEAPAGTGKSWLLAALAAQGGGQVAGGEIPPLTGFWDVPPVRQTAALVSGPVEGPDTARGRIILAKRPGTAIPGLARARVYGQVASFGAEALLLSAEEFRAAGLSDEEAAQAMLRTGGWACLIPAVLSGRAGQGALTEFLRDELLSQYPSAALAAYEAHLETPARRIDLRLMAGLPFVRSGGPLHPALAATRAPMLRAVRQVLAQRGEDATEARAIAVTQAALGRAPQAIATFQSVGAWQAAISALDQARGPFFIHRFGPQAFDRMLSGFPADLQATEEVLVLCRAVQAAKRGEISLMQHAMVSRWGEGIADAPAIIADRLRLSFRLRFFRLLLRIWEDFDIPDVFLEVAYRLYAEIPADDDLYRGSFYNTVLEFYIRIRHLPEAEHVAHRAAEHYARAQVPILSFYIDLHLGVIRLFQGDLPSARQHATSAGRHLKATPYDSPDDARLLALLSACIDYETGTPEALQRFLSLDLDALAQGEIWPTLVELVLIYGTQVLAETHSLVAARGFLDRWRVRQEQAKQFRSLIEIREIGLLQSAGRWTEAGRKAAAAPGRVTLGFVQGGEAVLATLHDRDEVAMALIWLRQMAQVMPQRPGLEALMVQMLDNAHLTGRQRIGLQIWRAHVLRRQRRQGEAEAALVRVLTLAAQAGAVATLAEERIFLTDLLSTRGLRAAADGVDSARPILRAMMAPGPARAAGLTRQETRMLRAIAEGAGNKAIANLLGLSESTVKFHLANLYRKLGVPGRRQAVAAARALRLLD